MKNRAKSVVCCLTAILLCTLSGCQMAQADKAADAAQDRLAGVFVTMGHLDLFDMQGYVKDALKVNSSGEITLDGATQEYQGRLYATQTKKTLTNKETGETTETAEYAFADVGGISYFNVHVPAATEQNSYYTSMTDDAVSDANNRFSFGDMENSTEMEGTIYVSAGGPRLFYFNPVYQDAAGNVYVTGGTGASFGEEQTEGETFSQTMTGSQTMTVNGKAKKDSISIKVTVKRMNAPQKIAIVQMSADSTVLIRAEFTPGTLPEQITPEQGTDYIVVETMQTGADGKEKVTRALYGKDAKALESFWCQKDGYCVKQSTQILWPDATSLPNS